LAWSMAAANASCVLIVHFFGSNTMLNAPRWFFSADSVQLALFYCF
jgi:hypothetical protein